MNPTEKHQIITAFNRLVRAHKILAEEIKEFKKLLEPSETNQMSKSQNEL
jgi:hypothetical protein